MNKQEIMLMLDDADSIIKNCPEDSVFDIVETYTNCTVEVLRNTKTGEVSVGFYRNGNIKAN